MSDRQVGEGWWLASDGKWYPPESHPSRAGAGDHAAPPAEYAGFWRRLAAVIIDSIIVSIAGAIVVGGFDEATFPGTLFGIAAGWLYWAGFESSERRATPGKMALGIRVTDLEGNRITLGRATARHFGKFVSAAILLIGFLMAGFTAKKQALHDLIAETLVVWDPR